MPEKEGIETIRELKLDFPDMKIIAMSGGIQKMTAEKALTIAKSFGASYTLSKPFCRKDLLTAISELI